LQLEAARGRASRSGRFNVRLFGIRRLDWITHCYCYCWYWKRPLRPALPAERGSVHNLCRLRWPKHIMKSSRQQTAGDVIVIPWVSVIDRRPLPLKLTWHRVTFTILHAVAAERLVTVSWDDSRWIRQATEARGGGQLVFAALRQASCRIPTTAYAQSFSREDWPPTFAVLDYCIISGSMFRQVLRQWTNYLERVLHFIIFESDDAVMFSRSPRSV